ncbi:hypothetical protein F5X68DRAFT_217937, partial [Plectosphaerella plurivora]
MTAVTMDVADLVKQMSENLEAIHAAVAGLSTTEHEAKLDELEQKRDTLLGDLKTEYDTEKEELAAKRKAEEEAVAEARRKEDEEREARRKAEDEEVRTRNESQDAERLGKFDDETKRVEDEADDGMDAVEAEVQKLLAEGEAKLKELEEKRKDINRMLEEKMSAPLPPVVPRKRARDKAAEAAAAAAAAVAAGAGVAAGVDAAADASADAPADPPAEAAPTDAAEAATDADPTPDDAKPDEAAEAGPVEADAENKENSKSEAIDGTAAPASEEAEEGADGEAGPGEVDETAEAVQEEETMEDTKEEDVDEGSKEDELKEEETTTEAPPIEVPAEEVAEDAAVEESAVDPEAAPPADEVDDVVASRSLDEVPEPAPASTDDATPKDEPAEEIPNYYDTTSPTIPQNDTSPVPNDDFELSSATDEVANETEEPISKDEIEETAAEDAAPAVEEEVVAAASVEPEAEAEATTTIEEPAAVAEEPAADTLEVAEGEFAVAEADSPTETVSEEAQPRSLEMNEPAPTVETDTVDTAEAATADATETEAVVEPAAEITEVVHAADLTTEEVVQSEDAPEPTVAEDAEDATLPEIEEHAETSEPTIAILEVSETMDDAEKDRSLVAEPAGHEVLSAEPDTAEPTVDEAAVKDVAVSEPAVEEVIVKEVASDVPLVEKAAEHLVAEEPVVEEAAVEEPSIEEAAAAEPVVEEVASEELPAEKAVVEDAARDEAAVDQPVVEEPAVEDATGNEVASDNAVIEEAAAEQPIAEETASKDLVLEELATSTPPMEEPVAEDAAAETPFVEEPTAEEAAIIKETAAEPIAKELLAEESTLDNLEPGEPAVEVAVEEVVAAEDAAFEDPEMVQAVATKEVSLDEEELAVDTEASSIPIDVENSVITAATVEEANPADVTDTADVLVTNEMATKAVSDEAAITVEEAAEEQAIAAEAVVEAGEPETDEPVDETEPAAKTTGEENETTVEARALDLEAEGPVAAISPEAVPSEKSSAEDTPLEDLGVSEATAAAEEPSLEHPEAEDVLPSDDAIAATEPDVHVPDDVGVTIGPSDDEPLVAATASSDITEVQAAPADDLPRDLDVDASEPAAIVETSAPADDDGQASEIAKADRTVLEAPSETPVDDEVALDTNAELKSDEHAVPQDDPSLEASFASRSFVLDASDDDDNDDAAIPAEAAVAEPEVLDTPVVSEVVEPTTAEVFEEPAAPAAIEEKATDDDDELTPAIATDAQPEDALVEEPALSEPIAGEQALNSAASAASDDEDEAQAVATDPFSDAAALTDSDAPVTEAEAIDESPATALNDKASSAADDDAKTAENATVEDDAVSVLTAIEEPSVNVADADQALDAPAQPEDVNEPEAPLHSPANTTRQPAIDVPADVTALADDHSDAPAVEKGDDSEVEAPTATAAADAAGDINPNMSMLSEAAEASSLNDDDATEGDAAVPLVDRELSPADVQDSTIDVAAEGKLDRHDTPEPESNPVDGPVVAMAFETAASPASPYPGVSDDPEPIAASPSDAEDDSDDDLLDIPIKPDTVDSQLTLVNGADTPIAIKSIEEPPLSPQSDAGSDAHEDDSFLGTRDDGASAEEAGLAFEKHRDTPDASPSPGEGEDQPPIVARVQDAPSDDGHDASDTPIPAATNNDNLAIDTVAPSIEADAHTPFGDEVDSADDHLTDSEDESPFGLSVPGTQDRSLAASSFAASPEMHDDGEPGHETSFNNGDRAIVDDFAEASRPSTPSEYGEVGRSAPEGLSYMDTSAASAEEESIPSSPLIESPYDLDDFVEDVATKHPLSPLPEEEDEDSNPFFADETSTLVGGHKAMDDSPNQTFRINMDEPESPTQEDTQEDPFHLSYETRHQSDLAQHDEPFEEPSAPNAAVDKQPFDFRFDAETPSNIADAPAERDQVALSGLGLNTFDLGVSHQEQNEFAQLVSQDNNPFRSSSRGALEETTATRGNSDFGRPKTFDPWDRQKSPELVQRGFGQPSPGLNAPDLSTRSWTPAESPPVSPYRAASPDFKPWGTSSKPTSPALSQKWAPIGNNTDDQSSQSGWGGLPSARQQPALSFSPAPAFTPTTANTNLGYRRSEYSYEDDSDGVSDYGKETKQDNRSSNGSLQDQFNGYRIKEQTIRVVDNHDAESTQSAVSTPRVCQPGPKLAPQSSSRDPLPSPLRLRHSVEGLPEPTSPNRNPFARPEPPRPQTPPSQAFEEEEIDPAMFMPRDVTNVPWHARNDSAPVSLRSQSTLSSSPSSPVHSALHADKNEPVIRDSWPARPRNDSNLTDATGPDYDPFRHDTKTYQEPVIPVNQRWPASTSIPNASPVRTANDSPGTMFQKMRSIFENQGQGSPTRGRAGTDSSSPTRSRPVSGVWVPVRQSRQFATGAQVWESAFGDGRGTNGQRDDPDE